MSLLRAHQIAPYFFNLAGAFSPISIRDQMVRAQAVVEDAVAEGLIAGALRPLLVVGAGAAGATAAIWAARHGVATTLIDQQAGAFNLQAGCQTRWLDSAQYDWPAEHWASAAFPATPIGSALPWGARVSRPLALRWRAQLAAARKKFSGVLTVHYRTTVMGRTPVTAGVPPQPIGWQMTLGGRGAGVAAYGMVLWTVGFAHEVCTCGAYRGFAFWETDQFDLPNVGLPPGTPPQVVISGSGDGALQDFLRITTGLPSARAVYLGLFGPGRSLAASRTQLERQVLAAEDVAGRAYSWGPGVRGGALQRNDHAVLDTLHTTHDQVVQGLLFGPGGGLTAASAAALSALVKAPPQIRLIHSCTHFGNSYALNRFLVLLIARYLESLPGNGPGSVLIGGRRTVSPGGVRCVAHPPGGPQACHGLGQEVDLESLPDCTAPPPAPGAGIQTLPANVVVIRHGSIRERCLPGPCRSPSRARSCPTTRWAEPR
jgi:hypothetical protein